MRERSGCEWWVSGGGRCSSGGSNGGHSHGGHSNGGRSNGGHSNGGRGGSVLSWWSFFFLPRGVDVIFLLQGRSAGGHPLFFWSVL